MPVHIPMAVWIGGGALMALHTAANVGVNIWSTNRNAEMAQKMKTESNEQGNKQMAAFMEEFNQRHEAQNRALFAMMQTQYPAFDFASHWTAPGAAGAPAGTNAALPGATTVPGQLPARYLPQGASPAVA